MMTFGENVKKLNLLSSSTSHSSTDSSDFKSPSNVRGFPLRKYTSAGKVLIPYLFRLKFMKTWVTWYSVKVKWHHLLASGGSFSLTIWMPYMSHSSSMFSSSEMTWSQVRQFCLSEHQTVRSVFQASDLSVTYRRRQRGTGSPRPWSRAWAWWSARCGSPPSSQWASPAPPPPQSGLPHTG